MIDVVAIFDIGKTNKKFFLFDAKLQPVYQSEQFFSEIADESGFPCDDFKAITFWMIDIINGIVKSENYKIRALNFSTYGASLAFLGADGRLLTPIYNYLKPMPAGITDSFYSANGGVTEFSRKTASPALGFLNSGLQVIWLKKTRPEIFRQVEWILHLPQYFSYIFTGITTSEYTSIGCHTVMWDFDTMGYHSWLKAHEIKLPSPLTNNQTFRPSNREYPFKVGIGIHDSSASLAPYIMEVNEKFILVSTGTWCINMNPFNPEPLTKDQLEKDCLCYLSITQEPVKSSRLFLGYLHNVNLERIAGHFNVNKKYHTSVNPDEKLINELSQTGPVFFKDGLSSDYIDRSVDLTRFIGFDEAYHRLVVDLADLTLKSISLILPEHNDIKNIFISGGFSRNGIFMKCLARNFKDKIVYTSQFENSSALGAALMVYQEMGLGNPPVIDLGLKEWSFTS